MHVVNFYPKFLCNVGWNVDIDRLYRCSTLANSFLTFSVPSRSHHCLFEDQVAGKEQIKIDLKSISIVVNSG